MFKFKSGILTKTNDGLEVDLCRIYDDSIKNKYMQKGDAVAEYEEKAFAHAVFFASAKSNKIY